MWSEPFMPYVPAKHQEVWCSSGRGSDFTVLRSASSNRTLNAGRLCLQHHPQAAPSFISLWNSYRVKMDIWLNLIYTTFCVCVWYLQNEESGVGRRRKRRGASCLGRISSCLLPRGWQMSMKWMAFILFYFCLSHSVRRACLRNAPPIVKFLLTRSDFYFIF